MRTVVALLLGLALFSAGCDDTTSPPADLAAHEDLAAAPKPDMAHGD